MLQMPTMLRTWWSRNRRWNLIDWATSSTKATMTNIPARKNIFKKIFIFCNLTNYLRIIIK